MAVELSQSGRLTNLVAVSQGRVFRLRPGETTWTEATNTTGDSPPLIFTGVVASAANQQKLWFADGSNWCVYDPSGNTLDRWAASLNADGTKGVLPVDSANNTPRLICTWRGRTCVSGLLLAGQQLFMSAVDNPLLWDYLPNLPSPTDAFATTVGPQGAVGDEITALIPWSDDYLIIGTAQEIHILQGDPKAGGQLGRLTNAIGIAFGRAWAQDPYGTVYFFSNKTGIYSMVPGQVPQRISQRIDPLLVNVDTGANGIRLIWDDRFQALHVFITPLAAAGATTHFVWEQRTGAWFEEEFANPNHNPLAVVDFDGNLASDRSVLIGGWDGYVRTFDAAAGDDDGTPIESEILLGPVNTKNLDAVMMRDAVCVLGETSNPVTYEVLADDTAEKALTSTPVQSGTFTAGRNNSKPIRRVAHSLYIRIKGLLPWSFESLRILVGSRGSVLGRGRGRRG